MATVARLNQVASQTPYSTRKRPRSSDLQDATPQKRQAIEDNVQQERSTETRPTASRSVTRLRSRLSLPASTPAPKPRGKDVYQLQGSPDRDGETENLKGKAQGARKGTKKKRTLNRKGDNKGNGTVGFDKRRVSTINPLVSAKVTLSTFDSPAKNTRAKREMPLKKLDTNYIKVVPLDAEPGSPELGIDYKQNNPPTSGQPSQRHDEVNSEDDREETDKNDEPQKLNRDTTGKDTERTENGDEVVTNSDAEDEDVPVAQTSSWQQSITELDRNFMAREQEERARQEQPGKKEGKDKQQGATTIHRPNSSRGNGTRSGLQSQKEREETQEDEQTDPDEDEEANDDVGTSEARAEPTKKKRRPKMTEEEKSAKKEAAARQRQENAIETEKADAEDFDARAKKFIEGIEDYVYQIGGLEAWSKLGAGARTITDTPEVEKKTELKEARAQNLWTKLNRLQDIFSGRETADEEHVSHTIRRLKEKSTETVLTRGGNIKQGDTTVVDIYEQLIPLSVEVLREAFKERFVGDYDHCWKELRDLVEIAISLCDVASGWQPRPSILVGGIRQQVRQNIRPSLAIIQNHIKHVLVKLEVRQKMTDQLASYNRRRELKIEEKRRAWQQMNLECSSRELPQSGGYVSSDRGDQRAAYEAEQAEEINGSEARHPTSNSSNYHRPQSILRRQPTEEIPAPDPNISWSEKENVALLNGLQKYFNDDRYARIMEDPKFAKALSEKDVDQCMARARFYQAGCSQILKEKAEAGDSSFDWLRTV